MQKVIAQFNIPGMTSKQYDQVIKDLRAAGHERPGKRIYHVAAEMPGGWFVIDVWESAEALSEFAGILMPILVNNSVTPPQPALLPVHNDIL
jgi:hypothetical protein